MQTVASSMRLAKPGPMSMRGWALPPACHGHRLPASFHVVARPDSSTVCQRRHALTQCSAAAKEVYQGRFGAWSLEPSDVAEVWGYRVGISVTALAMLLTSAVAFLPPGDPLRSNLLSVMDPVCVLGAAGLGVSLQLIHIYIAPLKRALQALWLVGTGAGLYLMVTECMPVAMYVAKNPWAVWLVGPLFASLTGVAFKEGFCYNKWEAAGLFGTIPILMLSHMFSAPEEGQKGMLAAMCIMMTVFAARKYTQPLKDDVGDKSVFMYLSASPEEQERMAAASVMNGADEL